jgi:hypothetical protein
MVLAVPPCIVAPRSNLDTDYILVEVRLRPLRHGGGNLRPHDDPAERSAIHVAKILRYALVLEVDVPGVRACGTP